MELKWEGFVRVIVVHKLRFIEAPGGYGAPPYMNEVGELCVGRGTAPAP